MVTVKCITLFHDLTDEVMRNPGDEWKCTKERGDMLNARNLVQIIADDAVVQPEENKAVKPTYKKK
jgi:hypothetical protein